VPMKEFPKRRPSDEEGNDEGKMLVRAQGVSAGRRRTLVLISYLNPQFLSSLLPPPQSFTHPCNA
jgi:hypothetical protein